MHTYEYQNITRENLPDLVSLLNEVMHMGRPMAYFQKKYNAPLPIGQNFGCLAYDKSNARAVASVVLLHFLIVLPDGQTLPVTQFTDTCTRPGHRLMSTLLRMVIEQQIKLGTRLFYVMPNQDSIKGLMRIPGFTQIGQMEAFELKIRTFPLEALCRRLSVQALFHWWAKMVLSPFLAPKGFVLKNSVLEEGNIGILHDKSFFENKSFSFNRLCRFSGIDSWLKFEGGLLVGDVMLPQNCSDLQFDAWLSKLKKIARWMGLRKIIFQTDPRSQLGGKMSERYRAIPSWAVCCKADENSMPLWFEKIRFGYGDFDTF